MPGALTGLYDLRDDSTALSLAVVGNEMLHVTSGGSGRPSRPCGAPGLQEPPAWLVR